MKISLKGENLNFLRFFPPRKLFPSTVLLYSQFFPAISSRVYGSVLLRQQLTFSYKSNGARVEFIFRAGGERVYRLGANGPAPRQHEGCVRAGIERCAVRGAARANRRSLHPEAHEKTKQSPYRADSRQREGADAQDLFLRVRLSDEGR